MAQTKVVNPRRARNSDGTFKSKGRRKNPSAKKRKTRAYGSARRRRRNPEPAAAPSKRARVRSVYSYGGYRMPNPSSDIFDMDYLWDVAPAATLGDFAGRFAAKMAGPFEEIKATVNGQPVTYTAPGLKHALAIVLGAHFGGSIADSVLGEGKGPLAKIGALGFGGSLFLRKRFMRDSTWVKENILLDGVDDMDDGDADDMGAFEQRSAIGGFEQTSAIGADEQPQIVQGPDGQFYMLSGAQLGAFEQQSSIGMGAIRQDPAVTAVHASSDSTFGYSSARRR